MIGRTNGGAKGGGGELHGASIQVSTSEASLIGTVCQLKQNNTVIKTKVFNSGGVALFTDIQEVDTYTVVATDGVNTATDSVSVTAADIVNKTVLTATVTFATTITFDLYSASNDTVYYMDNGSPVTLCVTDSTGKASGVTLTIPASGLTLTLWSSVADNPLNLSQKYSQSVTFTNSTSIVYFMVGGANTLYWDGNECTWLANGWISNLYMWNPSKNDNYTVTKNTNDVTLAVSNNSRPSIGINNSIDLTQFSSLHVTFKRTNIASSETSRLYTCSTRPENMQQAQNLNGNDLIASLTNTDTTISFDISSINQTSYMFFLCSNGTLTIKKIWLE